MADKIHALITRGYPKGRDWLDVQPFLERPEEATMLRLDYMQSALSDDA